MTNVSGCHTCRRILWLNDSPFRGDCCDRCTIAWLPSIMRRTSSQDTRVPQLKYTELPRHSAAHMHSAGWRTTTVICVFHSKRHSLQAEANISPICCGSCQPAMQHHIACTCTKLRSGIRAADVGNCSNQGTRHLQTHAAALARRFKLNEVQSNTALKPPCPRASCFPARPHKPTP